MTNPFNLILTPEDTINPIQLDSKTSTHPKFCGLYFIHALAVGISLFAGHFAHVDMWTKSVDVTWFLTCWSFTTCRLIRKVLIIDLKGAIQICLNFTLEKFCLDPPNAPYPRNSFFWVKGRACSWKLQTISALSLGNIRTRPFPWPPYLSASTCSLF